MSQLQSLWHGDLFYSRPKLRSFLGTNRAANTEFTETVPAGKLWLLQSLTVTNVQGGGGTALTLLTLTDGTNSVGKFPGSSSAQNAGVTAQYNWCIGVPLGAGAAATNILAPIPSGCYLGPGYVIASSTTDAGGAKDFGAPTLLVIEYSTILS